MPRILKEIRSLKFFKRASVLKTVKHTKAPTHVDAKGYMYKGDFTKISKYIWTKCLQRNNHRGLKEYFKETQR